MRKFTKLILEMVDEEALDKRQLIQDLLNWMSEADVEEFCEHHCLIDNEEEDE